MPNPTPQDEQRAREDKPLSQNEVWELEARCDVHGEYDGAGNRRIVSFTARQMRRALATIRAVRDEATQAERERVLEKGA